MKLGPQTKIQLARLDQHWRQGEHILIVGETGSGKTTLARHIDDIRVSHGGYVMVLVGKLLPDPTINDDYLNQGWVRWKSIRELTGHIRKPSVTEQRVLLWPNVERAKGTNGKRVIQMREFKDAIDHFVNKGRLTVHIDEGLYMTHPQFMNLGNDIALMHQQGRSGKLSVVTLIQRPSHVPLVIYSSVQHAFVGRTNVANDAKRLAEIRAGTDAKELIRRIGDLTKHQFLWVPRDPDLPVEVIDMVR